MKIKKIAIVKCEVESVLMCVKHFIGKVDFILIGDINKTRELAKSLDVDLEGLTLVNILEERKASEYASELASKGEVDILMKGLVQTGTFMKSILRKDRDLLYENGGVISLISRFILPKYHKPIYLTDCGINIEPDLKQKESILRNAIRVVKSLGVEKPKVACVCPIEFVNPRIKSTVDGEALSKMDIDGAIIEGPISFDVSLSKHAAEVKGFNSSVAGDADILLFNNIDSGNVVYKSLSLFGDASICGIVSGLKIPVILTSRADETQVKIDSIQLALDMF